MKNSNIYQIKKLVFKIDGVLLYGIVGDIDLNFGGIHFTVQTELSNAHYLIDKCNNEVEFSLQYFGEGFEPLKHLLNHMGKGRGVLYLSGASLNGNNPEINFNIQPNAGYLK